MQQITLLQGRALCTVGLVRRVAAKSQLTKRIPVREETWATLSRLKEPGETFDELLVKMAELEAGRRLACDLQAIRQKGEYEDLE